MAPEADAVQPTAVPAAVDWPVDAVEVGRILGGWGVQGALRVHPLSPEAQALLSARRWFLQIDRRAGPDTAGARRLVLAVRQPRAHGDAILATSPEVADRDAADALKGARVYVSRSLFPPIGDGEYYWVDLIGARVVNRQGEDLGTVGGLIDTGPHAVLQVVAPAPAGGDAPGERLIPFVGAYVDDVDLEQRQIRVDWGLDY